MGVKNLRCGACKDEMLTFPFTMAFQPVVDLTEHKIDAYEALVRGLKGEGAGRILSQVGGDTLYPFDQACRVKAIEMAADLKMGCRLNINFLPNAVYEPAACIRQTLDTSARTGFPLEQLTFEITENENVSDLAHLMRIITEYQRHGFKIALDDFGTGYSGLSRLVELKPVIGEWVLGRACCEAAQWHEGLRIAVNVSALQIRSGRRFTDVLIEELRQSRLPASRLELEITETAILQDTEETPATLNCIEDLGVAIAMDDFGTGYSSLSHLRNFPFGRVKIDKSFVRGLGPVENECTAIVRAVIGLCASLGLGLTAEGVETKAQMEWLKAEGDVEAQGFLFSKAVPVAEIPALIETLSKGAAEVKALA